MSDARVLAAASLFAFGGWLLPDFYLTILSYIGLYGITVIGVVLLTGVTGVTSFGQAAFVGISAYASTIVTLYGGASPLLGLFAALVLTLGLAAILGLVTLRLSGHYLPLGTIAWGLSAYLVFGNVQWLGGHTGLTGVPPLWLGAVRIESARAFYFLIWSVALATAWLVDNMLGSRAGRAMRAVKSSRAAAESFGVNIGRTRLVAFLYAAVLASISGWLYAHMLRFVNPTPFSLTMGIEYLFMAVLGGAGHVWGAFAGAGIVLVAKEALQMFFPAFLTQGGSFELILFGALVIMLLQVNRDKGLGAVTTLGPRCGARAKKGAPRTPLPRRRRRPPQAAGLPLLQVDGLTKLYGGITALRDIGFSVGRNEIVAVIGPNGAGKTTLFNVLTGALQPDAGHIVVGGVQCLDLTPQQAVSLGLARTFQHLEIVPELTVAENVMLGAHLRGRARSLRAALRLSTAEENQLWDEAMRRLSQVGLAHLADQSVTKLSLGEHRLMEIARALCADPDLLLLDEPGAGLGYKDKDVLAGLLRDLRANHMGILLVEHDLPFVADLADRIIVLDIGQKILEDTPGVVCSDRRVAEAYIGASAA